MMENPPPAPCFPQMPTEPGLPTESALLCDREEKKPKSYRVSSLIETVTENDIAF